MWVCIHAYIHIHIAKKDVAHTRFRLTLPQKEIDYIVFSRVAFLI